MSEIKSRPSTKEYRENYDRVFKSVKEPKKKDESVDWGEFKVVICCTNDPHFGG